MGSALGLVLSYTHAVDGVFSAFRLTETGMSVIKACRITGHHEHEGHEPESLFEEVQFRRMFRGPHSRGLVKDPSRCMYIRSMSQAVFDIYLFSRHVPMDLQCSCFCGLVIVRRVAPPLQA